MRYWSVVTGWVPIELGLNAEAAFPRHANKSMESNKEGESNIVVENHSTPNPRAVICQYCKGDFGPNFIANHERHCANKTLAERQKATDARAAYREKYSNAALAARNGDPRDRYNRGSKLDEPVVTTERRRRMQREEFLAKQREYNKKRPRAHKNKTEQLAKAVSKASSVLFDGKRVQITISLDWETVRAMIIQLGPDVAIDKIELI